MIKYFATVICYSLIITLQAQMTGKETTIEGSKVRIYLVQKGETLYAISRKFDVSPSILLKFNPQAENGLSIGQEFYVPFKTTVSPAGDPVRVHTVKKGETLYSIARGYQVEEEELKNLNGMTSNDLNIGQQLKIPTKTKDDDGVIKISGSTITHTVAAGETLFGLSRKYGISPEDIIKLNDLSSQSLNIGQKLIIKNNKVSPGNEVSDQDQKPKEEVEKSEEEKDEKKENEVIQVIEKEDEEQVSTEPMPTDRFVEVVEEGLAELIPDSDNTRKYLALHRTVKPGTIIRVRNEMNGREVWARVIGTLPENAENKNLLIKISKAAYDRLGALDKRFRVTITYIP